MDAGARMNEILLTCAPTTRFLVRVRCRHLSFEQSSISLGVPSNAQIDSGSGGSVHEFSVCRTIAFKTASPLTRCRVRDLHLVTPATGWPSGLTVAFLTSGLKPNANRDDR